MSRQQMMDEAWAEVARLRKETNELRTLIRNLLALNDSDELRDECDRNGHYQGPELRQLLERMEKILLPGTN